MAKDFAFQFCPGDYLRDTQCLSEKAQVAYDRIMCEHIRNVSTDMLSIWIAHEKVSFFAKRLNDDERAELFHVLREVGGKNGGFQIEWVAEKVAERQSYIESRTINGTQKKKKQSAKHMPSTNKAKGKLPDSDSNIDISSVLDIIPKIWLKDEFENLLKKWIAKRKKKPDTDLVILRVSELITKYPNWIDAKKAMTEAAAEGWMKFVYVDTKSDLKNGKETKSIYEPGYYDKA